MLSTRRYYDLFDDLFGMQVNPSMKTDVKEIGTDYEVDVELPGFNKEDLGVDLKDGYLTVSAKHEENKDEKDSDGKYIRRERHFGSCNRSFYVGNTLSEEDIHAAYENGILKLTFPKEKEKLPETKKLIEIQ